jgi:protein SCO1/2
MIGRQRLARIGLVLALVLGAVAVGIGIRLFVLGPGGRGGSIVSGVASIGGPFSLVDQNGKTRTDADFRGKYMLVYFGYTFCPDICPTELQTMSEALDQLGSRAARIQPIFITVDPARDKVPVMKEYVRHFHPSFIGLTGTANEIAAAAKAYRVYYAKAANAEGGNDYLMDHSGFVYLMGPDGHYLTHFTPQTTPKQMAAAIARYP